MNQAEKNKILARVTYHGTDGRFSPKATAVTASRNGERLRVVRQLRRLHRPKTATEQVMQTVLRSNLARTKATLTGALTAPGFVNVGDVLFQDR